MTNGRRNASHFQKGSGVYTCSACGKRTRSTGRGDNEHVGLCAACYDEAGWENQHDDEGHSLTNPCEGCPICEREAAAAAAAKPSRFAEVGTATMVAAMTDTAARDFLRAQPGEENDSHRLRLIEQEVERLDAAARAIAERRAAITSAILGRGK